MRRETDKNRQTHRRASRKADRHTDHQTAKHLDTKVFKECGGLGKMGVRPALKKQIWARLEKPQGRQDL